MITADGWIDWTIRRPGPSNKVNPGINPVRGIFCHSAEGYVGGLWSQLANAPVSWHLSNLFDGTLYQHYPLTARCWHATAANNSYIGMEHEGKVPNDPTLTDAQVVTTRRVIAELAQRYGWTPSRPQSSWSTDHTLWEHNEVVRLGGTGSACPSGRIPWDRILTPVQEEDDMKQHLWSAGWFEGRELPPTPVGEYLVMQAQDDWQLPDEARWVFFRCSLAPEMDTHFGENGHVRFFDGLTERPAGGVTVGTNGGSLIVAKLADKQDWRPDRGKTLNFRCDASTRFSELICIGYLVE